MKKGFTLVEILVVIAIIAILMSVTVGSYSFFVNRAQNQRAQNLVSETATALQTLIANGGKVPDSLLTASRGEGVLDERGAACLAVKKLMSLSYRTSEEDGETVYRLTGNDRFGLVTPWATDVLKKLPQGQGDSAKVPSGGTVRDHRLHFAIDDDGDGVTEARLGSRTVKVRKTAVVWCWGKNGKEDDYEMSMGGKGDADDIYSWAKDQEVRQ